MSTADSLCFPSLKLIDLVTDLNLTQRQKKKKNPVVYFSWSNVKAIKNEV